MANSSDMNPHGVGQRGEDLRTVDGRCRCCGLPYTYQGHGPNARPTYCGSCLPHYELPGEPPKRRESRLTVDHQRIVIYTQDLRDKLNEMAESVKESRRQTAAALQSRDLYRKRLWAVTALHYEVEDKGCHCGLPYPCSTVDAINE